MKFSCSIILGLIYLAIVSSGADFEEVSFATSDGGTIYANLYGDGPHAIVLAHGGVFNKESWHDLAVVLKQKRLQVLAVDFRGYGKSVAGREENGRHLDLLAGIDYLETIGAEQVSMLGGSMGGGAAAQAAVALKPGTLHKLILLAHVPVDTPEKLEGDKLFIVSEGDTRFVKSVKSQYKKAPNPKRLEILEGSAHAQHIFKTDQGPALTEMLVRFLTEE